MNLIVRTRIIGMPKIRCEGCGIEFYTWERHSFSACLRNREWREQQALLDQLELVFCGFDASQSRVIRHD
jgi:hypothetical protein